METNELIKQTDYYKSVLEKIIVTKIIVDSEFKSELCYNSKIENFEIFDNYGDLIIYIKDLIIDKNHIRDVIRYFKLCGHPLQIIYNKDELIKKPTKNPLKNTLKKFFYTYIK